MAEIKDGVLIKVEPSDIINGTYTIPEGVKSIGLGAFSGCTVLKEVTIPEGVKSIDEWAFWDCTGLKSITIPGGVKSIGLGAFSGCTVLKEVTIPEGVKSIGGWAFWGCTGLKEVTIPGSVESIGDWVFYGCTGLTSVTIPGSVTSIGGWAFFGCTGLKEVTIPESVTSIDKRAFDGCPNIAKIYIKDSDKKGLPIIGDMIKSIRFFMCKMRLPSKLRKKVKRIKSKTGKLLDESTSPPVKHRSKNFRYYLRRTGVVVLSALIGVLTLSLPLWLRKLGQEGAKSKGAGTQASGAVQEDWFTSSDAFSSSTTGLGFFHRLEMEKKLTGINPTEEDLLDAGIQPGKIDAAQAYFGVPKPNK